MRLLQLCREPRLYSCQRLTQAAEKAGYAMDILDPNRFLLKITQERLQAYYQTCEPFQKIREVPQPIAEYIGVIGRFGSASTEQGCRVLLHFERQQIACLNRANAFAMARDKWLSLQTLASAGIAVPDSLIAGDLLKGADLSVQLPAPMVIKTLIGSQGVGVMLAEGEKSAQSLFDTLIASKVASLAQAFIHEAQGHDIRAFVVGGEVVAAMQRIGQNGDFRANIHQGGRARAIKLSVEEQALAIKAANVIGLDVAGVDLIRAKHGVMVLEVNASPGLEMIEKVSGVDIAGKMIASLLAKKS
ncbi:ATP-grasp domain-containing protein [Bibersteinia trehalosi]|uniref:ATP-grasp domain-containing protein n=1 Tax=Bibersteinia trehalosi TaxID=47735 RepID=UPI00404541DE